MVASFKDLGREELRELLDELHDRYNTPDFIEADPISVPHCFSDPVDREIAGFLASTIAWGNRKAIVQSAHRMMRYMDNAPRDFVLNATDNDMAHLGSYVHRTFNGVDFQDFVRGLRHIIETWGSVGGFFEHHYLDSGDVRKAISAFRREFFSVPHDKHSEKHVSSIDRGAACKRIAMYMRWFVRKDDRGVDFGQWQKIPMSALYLPLDIHTGRMGRAMGLLQRRQDDWKAVEEITASLREFCPEDPTRYDYSLFGAGITKLFD